MKIEPGYYKCRDGRRARVLCTDAPGRFPVVGLIEIGDEANCERWRLDGSWASAEGHGGFRDLLAPWTEPKTVTVTPWLWLYKNGRAELANEPPAGEDRCYVVLGSARGQPIVVTEGKFDE
jgi:hypothetical protein